MACFGFLGIISINLRVFCGHSLERPFLVNIFKPSGKGVTRAVWHYICRKRLFIFQGDAINRLSAIGNESKLVGIASV